MSAVYPSRVVNTVINQYLLGLGEFATDSFEHNQSHYLVMILFLAATFFT